MARVCLACLAILLLSTMAAIPGTTHPAAASPSLAKKKCHYITKKVHGKKKRVKVCKKAKTTITTTPTPTPSPTPTLTPLPSAMLYPTVYDDLAGGYAQAAGPGSSVAPVQGDERFAYTGSSADAAFALTPYHYVVNSSSFAVRVNFHTEAPDDGSVISADVLMQNTPGPAWRGAGQVRVAESSQTGAYAVSEKYAADARDTPIDIGASPHPEGLELRFLPQLGGSNLRIIDSGTGAVLTTAGIPFSYSALFITIEIHVLSGHPQTSSVTFTRLQIGARNPGDVSATNVAAPEPTATPRPSGWSDGAQQPGDLIDGHAFGVAELPDGRVAVTNGYYVPVYDPTSGLWDRNTFPNLPGQSSSVNGGDYRTLLYLPSNELLAIDMNHGKAATLNLAHPDAWVPTGNMVEAHGILLGWTWPAVAVLHDGRVLVAGGDPTSGVLSPTNLSEIYDPATRQWTRAGDMPVAEMMPEAITLYDGEVLVFGGAGPGNTPTDVAELFDPPTGQWRVTGNMIERQEQPSAVLLADGRVLSVGGHEDQYGTPQPQPGGGYQSEVTTTVARASAQIYDPTSGTWIPAPDMLSVHGSHGVRDGAIALAGPTVVRLSDGRVLVAGGIPTAHWDQQNADILPLSEAEIYSPASNSWSPAGNLAIGRTRAAGVLLPSGQVLVIGGIDRFLASGSPEGQSGWGYASSTPTNCSVTG